MPTTSEQTKIQAQMVDILLVKQQCICCLIFFLKTSKVEASSTTATILKLWIHSTKKSTCLARSPQSVRTQRYKPTLRGGTLQKIPYAEQRCEDKREIYMYVTVCDLKFVFEKLRCTCLILLLAKRKKQGLHEVLNARQTHKMH